MRELKLPVPRLPTSFPGEALVDRLLDSIGRKVSSFPLVRLADEITQRIPYPAEARLGTPFGDVRLPPLNLPRLTHPELDPRRKEAIKAAIPKDIISELINRVPAVGSYAGIILEPIVDTFDAKVTQSLTPEERDVFLNWEKKSPFTTVALVQTFIRVKARR